ncbi:hypothetical protein KJ853_02130 [Patescibacteria group bacterium]|nr:hypothetical protein [Patescibacteria group bacterium]
MASLERAILPTLIYCDLLDRPLTDLEIYKYLLGPNQRVSFFDFKQTLTELVQTKKVESRNGLFFFIKRSNIIKIREKRLKLAQLKWKKLKKLSRWLTLVPFLRLAAVTGSLTAYNTRRESDFDLLIVAKNGRLWLARTLITALTGLLGVRRHGTFTKDRICLNCYLTQDSLKIKPQAKPHDFHSAQEYGRLTPLLEIEKGLYQKFLQKNSWLNQYLNFYPWPNNQTAKKIEPGKFLSLIRETIEWLLEDATGNWLEKKLGAWQTQRIKKKSETEPADQIYVSNECLMFHPKSKSYELVQKWQAKIDHLNADYV